MRSSDVQLYNNKKDKKKKVETLNRLNSMSRIVYLLQVKEKQDKTN